MQFINHDHPICQASLILRRCEKDLYFERPRLARERDVRRKALDLLVRAQLRLADQIKDTPGCWEVR